jgi:nicotinate-nucleotide adenylyltransferase
MTMRVGVLGGTFDPIHIGHLRAAEEAMEALDLDTFLFLPAALPPHKLGQETASFEQRWQMLLAAIAGNPRFRASDLELSLSGASYTVLSLQALHREFENGGSIHFLLGLDAFLEINTWWHYMELFELASMVVLRRPRYQERELEKMLRGQISSLYAWDPESSCYRHPTLLPVYYLKITRIDVSSTQIRSLVRTGKSIRYLVPKECLAHIKNWGLYGPNETFAE